MTSCDVQAVAAALTGSPGAKVGTAKGGGNNRLYQVWDGQGQSFALKSYPPHHPDQHHRLRAEFRALKFMTDRQVTNTPQAFAADEERNFALYEWVEGQVVTSPTQADMDQVLAFVDQLIALSHTPQAQGLSLAAEACLSGAEIVAQVQRRRARFAEVAGTEPALAAFLADEFDPVAAQVIGGAQLSYDTLGWDFAAEIAPEQRVLSPSDFGFHNALKRPDGRLVFLDFEYFGWDDPVRLVADFLQHPGMTLSPDLLNRFETGAVAAFAARDAGFTARFRWLFPVVGLRWCMILLNEFLPERWYRRQFAGIGDDRDTVIQRQLAKARHRLTAIKAYVAAKGA